MKSSVGTVHALFLWWVPQPPRALMVFRIVAPMAFVGSFIVVVLLVVVTVTVLPSALMMFRIIALMALVSSFIAVIFSAVALVGRARFILSHCVAQLVKFGFTPLGAVWVPIVS